MTFLTKEEAQYASLDGYVNPSAPDHHISEVTILRPDGARYFYGIPAYNKFQKDVTFNVTGRINDCSLGEVTYGSGDNSVSNSRGIDHFFQADHTPMYAHSYLLTAVVSNDYVDIDGVPGPSDGDLGTYTKFNYDADPGTPGIQPTEANYKWRVPFNTNQASYSEGLKADELDDKGSYVYGEKELWYLQTIETKTHIAVFHTSERKDARGVAGENGGMAPADEGEMYKLDKIELFSKPDYEANGSNAIPIKTVHFEYTYELCPDIENNDGSSEYLNGQDINTQGGKLTLKKVYFTHEDSQIGRLSPYEFVYGHDDLNYNAEYNLKGYDRWGCYKNNDGANCSPLNTSNLPVPEFPYVEQDQATADINTAMWSLTDIKLPSGGKISLTYESDDYAYVQDRPAMEMFTVRGFGEDEDFDNSNMLYETSLSQLPFTIDDKDMEYLYFDLPQEYLDRFSPGLPSNSDIKKDFLGWTSSNKNAFGKNKLYFRFMFKLNMINPKYDYVPGYAEYSDVGICTNDNTKGFIKVKKVKLDDRPPGSLADVNPFSKAAWQFTQKYLPRIAHNHPDPTQNIGFQIASSLAANLTSIVEFALGPNFLLRTQGFSREVVLEKSIIRLENPNKRRLGGGCRVKKVQIWDNWDEMTATESAADYGQEYDYTITTSDGEVISSGVASYEPLIGGEENPFRQPLFYTEEQLLGPKDVNYMETPFGESFFPSPSVGYSKVTVKNLVREDGGGNQIVTDNATGKVVHEYYTAKDFPTIVKYTNVKPRKDKTSLVGQILGVGLRDHTSVSQGYTVELNDMHGREKAHWVYAENKPSPISGVEYKYQTTESTQSFPLLGGNTLELSQIHLDNEVFTVNKDGTVEKREIGVEQDMITDFRQSKVNAESMGLNFNTASFILPPAIPFIVPTVFPKFNSTETLFKSAVTTKVVNRFGILRETIAHDLGASVSTNNLAYDAVTGDVLLTQTYNEFNDPMYSFTYPAHWGYDRMGGAFTNIGAEVSLAIGGNDEVLHQNILVPGDELLTNANQRVWVWDDNPTDQYVYLIDEDGDVLQTGQATSGKIIRSGRRNQQQVSIGEVVSFKNPIRDVGGGNLAIVFDGATEILQASATEYKDKWSSVCEAFAGINTEGLERVAAPPGEDCQLVRMGIALTGSVENFPPEDFCVRLVDDPTSSQHLGWVNIVDISPILPLSANSNEFELAVNVTYADGSVEQLYLVSLEQCAQLWECHTNAEECERPIAEIINPFRSGLRGNWHALKSWTYLTGRTNQGLSTLNPDQQYDGVFQSFTPFWTPPSVADWVIDDQDWTWAAEATAFSPYGAPLENRDALYRYSAEVLGYNNTLVKAVGTNSDYNEIGFDGFEDYDFQDYSECCPGHFNFHEYSTQITAEESHTGRYSLFIGGLNNVEMERNLKGIAPTPDPDDVPYTLKDEDVLGEFEPKTYNGDRDYILSYWVKKGNFNNAAYFDYEDFEPIITINGGVNLIIPGYTSKSEIIDGWQRVEVRFGIGSGVTGSIKIRFENSSTTAHYLDDVRVHPFNGHMKSYVYDPVSYRLWAELDERNFATFYEYDENGTLLRVKKETERGVYTIQESRSSKKKAFN